MDAIFITILNMSLTAGFVIAAIMVARIPLKKAPKVISYILWAVAGFRLLSPIAFESAFSLLPYKSALIPQDIAIQAIPRINSGAALDGALGTVLSATAPVSSASPMQAFLSIGSYIWLSGFIVMMLCSVLSVVLLKRRLRGAAHIENNLYEANELKTPFVLGLFKPRVYIPTGLTGEERKYIVYHERMHIRRFDHAIKMLAYFLLCLHWFNPLAWAAFVLMGADMEMSCDERVIKELGGEIKNDYSLSLVRVAAGRKILSGSPIAFSEGGLKARIKNVLNFRKPSRIIITLAVAVAALLIIGFSANRLSGEGDNSPALVGESASATTGESVGATAGESVGATAGESVGATAGESVGATAGETVGATAGESASATTGEPGLQSHVDETDHSSEIISVVVAPEDESNEASPYLAVDAEYKASQLVVGINPMATKKSQEVLAYSTVIFTTTESSAMLPPGSSGNDKTKPGAEGRDDFVTWYSIVVVEASCP